MVKLGEDNRAIEYIDSLGLLHPEISELYYQKGVILKKRGYSLESRNNFRKALALSTRILRAPPEINEIIKSFSQRKGHLLVDIDSVCFDRPADMSPYEMIIDNLHPSLYGQYLIAQKLYNAIANEVVDRSIGLESVATIGEFNRLCSKMGITNRLVAQGYYFSSRLHYIFSLHRGYDPSYLLNKSLEFAQKAHTLDEAYFGPNFFLSLIYFENGDIKQGDYYMKEADSISHSQLSEAIDQLKSFTYSTGYNLAPKFLKAAEEKISSRLRLSQPTQ